MPYAILQKHPDPPTVEQLTRAFRALPELTDADAAQLCRNAYGIIIRGRSLDSARILQQALLEEGVETVVVDQARLPRPPHPRRLARAAVRPGGFLVYDLYGRERLIPWEQVTIVAAGSLRVTRTERRLRRDVETHGSYYAGGMYQVHVWKVDKTRERHTELLLDLLFNVEPYRSRINGRRFNYECLGPRQHPSKGQNYALLAGDILKHATNAWLSIGAAALRDGQGQTYEYPSSETFEEEVTWLCWQTAGCPGVVG